MILQTACFNPNTFPVKVFADDYVFEMVKRVRKGLLVELYGYAGWLILRTWND